MNSGFLALRRSALPLAAALCTWAFLVNRVVIHWTSHWMKLGAAAGLLPALIVFALWLSAGGFARGARLASAALLFLFVGGEARRAVLRHEYGASQGTAPLDDLLHPITTTDLTTPRFTVRVPQLGAGTLRVVHVTDLHVTEELPWEYFARIQSEIAALHPDLIVMTGDYLSRPDRLPLFERFLSGLPKPTLGAFATLGNHDYWAGSQEQEKSALQRAGVRWIGNSCTTITTAWGAPLRLCGTEEPWAPGANIPLQEEPVPTLALTHTPDNVYTLHERGVDAVFAGHTHGGQARLPGVGAVIVPSRYGRRFDRGHFNVAGTHLFVSAGTGADGPPLRIWCPPELLVADLVGRAPSLQVLTERGPSIR